MKKELPFRIPQTVIDELVAKTDIVETIGYHIKLKKQGKDYVALCPFHKESTPSFTVSGTKQFYYCFGCGAGGNVMNFSTEYLGKSFISVIQDMAEDHGVDLKPYLAMAQTNSLEYKLRPVLESVVAHFEECLAQEPNAREYLCNRGIDERHIEMFRIGFAPAGHRVVSVLAGKEDVLVMAGILENGSNGVYSLFRSRIIMPIRDTRGKVIGISGRTVEQDVKPKYKNSKETPLFSRNSVLYGLYESLVQQGNVDKLEHIDVMEGQLDVMASLGIGRPACGALGSSLSPQQLRLLMRHSKSTTFMFDGDSAGIKAMLQVGSLLLENLTSHEHIFSVVLLPEGEDPHSLITQNVDRFYEEIAKPLNWLDAMLEYMPEGKYTDDRGRIEFTNRCIELIHDTRDPLLRHQLIEKVSKRCGFPVNVIEERVLTMPPARSGHAAKRTAQEEFEETSIRFLRMAWDNPVLLKEIKHPTLWVEEGDGLVAMLGSIALEAEKGVYDGNFNDSEAQALTSNPEKLAEFEEKSRWRTAGAAIGRSLSSLGIPGLTEKVMAEEPESGSSLSASYVWHITGACAALGMQLISNKAKSGAMSEEDRERFATLMNIRRDAAKRLKQ